MLINFSLALSIRVFFARETLEVVKCRAGERGTCRTLRSELEVGPELKARDAMDDDETELVAAAAVGVELESLSRRTQKAHSLLRATRALMEWSGVSESVSCG